MNLTEYRGSDLEKKRSKDLMQLIQVIPNKRQNALDIGARDGYFSKLLINFYERVTALDLEKPSISHSNIDCVKGDITNLNFSDDSFDLVFCAEVLEHIPSHMLEKACTELSRVSSTFILIGVPYNQDIRVDRTTCYSCGGKNPPWGHVNSFDEQRLVNLFPLFNVNKTSFVGENKKRTNIVSTFMLDLAGNPYGTYTQEEECIHCGEKLKLPPNRTFLQKIYTKGAMWLIHIQEYFCKTKPNWIHILLKKKCAE